MDIDAVLADRHIGETQDSNLLNQITPRMLKRQAKQMRINMMKRQHLRDVMQTVPEAGTTYHLISNGKFDFWTFVPVMVGWLGERVDELYATTWTMSRANAVECLSMFDEGKVGRITFTFGEEFRSRETAVYGTLVEGLKSRDQRITICANHAKVLLLKCGDQVITVEGSANLTSNPRIEQYVITADPELYEFHRGWMEELIHVYSGREA